MDDKILLEDDIIDLTDLLEEGSSPKKPQQAEPRKRMVSDPDSFDLGKEISMDFDVSVEEIEHDSTVLADEILLDREKKPRAGAAPKDEMDELLKEPLGDIETEIDLAMKDKMEEVSLTQKEEEMLLQESPGEEMQPPVSEEASLLKEEILPLEEKPVAWEEAAPLKEEILSLDEKPVVREEAAPIKEEALPMEEKPVIVEEEAAPDSRPSPVPEPLIEQADVSPQVRIPADMPTEAILDAVITEFRKDMPALLEGIVRPVVKELLQEIISVTRGEVPGIVEKVIREEIEKLKKL
jgi:hypothetical protein